MLEKRKLSAEAMEEVIFLHTPWIVELVVVDGINYNYEHQVHVDLGIYLSYGHDIEKKTT